MTEPHRSGDFFVRFHANTHMYAHDLRISRDRREWVSIQCEDGPDGVTRAWLRDTDLEGPEELAVADALLSWAATNCPSFEVHLASGEVRRRVDP